MQCIWGEKFAECFGGLGSEGVFGSGEGSRNSCQLKQIPGHTMRPRKAALLAESYK